MRPHAAKHAEVEAHLDRLLGRKQVLDPDFAEMRKDEKYGSKILADVEVFGIERWELWGIGLRCRIKVLPHERDNVRREFTRRLVAEFDRRQIKSP